MSTELVLSFTPFTDIKQLSKSVFNFLYSYGVTQRSEDIVKLNLDENTGHRYHSVGWC